MISKKTNKVLCGLVLIVLTSVLVLAVWNVEINDKTKYYFSFNETTGTNIEDLVAGQVNGTMINMTDANWVGGKLGNALNFSGLSFSVVKFPQNTFLLEEGDWSFSFWIKKYDIVNKTFVMSNANNTLTGNKSGWTIQMRSDIINLGIIRNLSGENIRCLNNGSNVIGQWIHMVFVRGNNLTGTQEDVDLLYGDGTPPFFNGDIFDFPLISIVFPTNSSLPNETINFNISATDDNGIGVCLYSLDLGVSNFSMSANSSNTGFNATNSTMEEGSQKATFYCNDSLGSLNSTNVSFFIDFTFPIILEEDIDITPTTGSNFVTFNVTNFTETNCNNTFFSVFDEGGEIDDALENISFVSCNEINDTFEVSGFGNYDLTIYMRDVAGNENSTTKAFTTSSGGGGVPGGSGGGTIIIIPEGELGNWTMRTENDGKLYQFNMVPDSSRSKDIVFQNFEVQETEVDLTCLGDLCNYLTFQENPVTLPLQQEIKTSTSFKITLPNTIPEGDYVTNILGMDNRGKKNAITIEVNIGGNPFQKFITKLGSSKTFGSADGGISIPYFLIFGMVWLIVSILVHFAGIKRLPLGLLWSILIGLIAGVLVVIFF